MFTNLILALSLVFLGSRSALAVSSKTLNKGTKQVKSFLEDSKYKNEIRVHKYCRTDKTPLVFNCRELHLYVDKETGELDKNMFTMIFVESGERQVAGAAYFLRKKNGSYKAFTDDVFDNDVQMTNFMPNNNSLKVEFDNGGFPTIYKFDFPILGPKGVPIVDKSLWSEFVAFSKKTCVIVGPFVDSSDPDDVKTFDQKISYQALRF